VGPLLLGIADSSFLFLPFGNDLLVVLMVARNHHLAPLYVAMAAVGSIIGVAFLDVVCRKGGEEGLKKMFNAKRFEYLKRRMGEQAGWAVAVACLAPPPFPFTAVIAAASAFGYSRFRLLAVTFLARAIRYSLIGLAAIHWGRQILGIARSSEFYWSMVVFALICCLGSGLSIAKWVRRSRTAAPLPA
jgi:membrane protein YqaA with SNARE-associated domain